MFGNGGDMDTFPRNYQQKSTKATEAWKQRNSSETSVDIFSIAASQIDLLGDL